MANVDKTYLSLLRDVLAFSRKTKERWDGDEHSVQEMAELLTTALSLPAGLRTEGRERILELGLDNNQIAEKLFHIYKQLCNL